MNEFEGRVFVVLDAGVPVAAEVARLLAEAGASVLTVHQEPRGPEGRAVFAGDPSDEVDVETATTMAAELFGPVDAVVDLSGLTEGTDAPTVVADLQRGLR